MKAKKTAMNFFTQKTCESQFAQLYWGASLRYTCDGLMGSTLFTYCRSTINRCS